MCSVLDFDEILIVPKCILTSQTVCEVIRGSWHLTDLKKIPLSIFFTCKDCVMENKIHLQFCLTFPDIQLWFFFQNLSNVNFCLCRGNSQSKFLENWVSFFYLVCKYEKHPNQAIWDTLYVWAGGNFEILVTTFGSEETTVFTVLARKIKILFLKNY